MPIATNNIQVVWYRFGTLSLLLLLNGNKISIYLHPFGNFYALTIMDLIILHFSEFKLTDGLMVYTFVALVHWWFFVNLVSKFLDTGSTLFLSLSPDWFDESKFALQKKCLSQQIPLIPWNWSVLFPTAPNKLEPRCHYVSHRNRCDATANYLIPERFFFWASLTKFSFFRHPCAKIPLDEDLRIRCSVILHVVSIIWRHHNINRR